MGGITYSYDLFGSKDMTSSAASSPVISVSPEITKEIIQKNLEEIPEEISKETYIC